jgi:hypothetical protein
MVCTTGFGVIALKTVAPAKTTSSATKMRVSGEDCGFLTGCLSLDSNILFVCSKVCTTLSLS